jgi:uncharacterized membrane protein YphA (DoxX/SURF4 family)
MNKLTPFAVIAFRILLGGMFVFSGLNGFFNFVPMGSPPTGAAGQFMAGFMATGYFFPFLKSTELLVGVLIISGRFVPLALIILAPIMLNIFAFHLFLVPDGIFMASALGLMQVFLAWAYRDSFAAVLKASASPAYKRAKHQESEPAHRVAHEVS